MWAKRGTPRRGHWAVALAVAAVPLPALAVDKYWIAGSDFWDESFNWSLSPGGPANTSAPLNGDNAIISVATNIIVQRDSISPAYSSPGVASIRLSNTGVNLTTLQLDTSSNSLFSASMIVGDTGGHAQVLHQGGSNTVTGNLILANNTGTTGDYTLSGNTSLLTVGNITNIGQAGTATFTQSAGTHTAVAYFVGTFGTGTYNLSGGVANATADDSVGYNGIGTFNQSGGTHATGTLYLGRFTGTGTYSMSNSAQLNVGTVEVGLQGTGTFNQTGGTHTATSVIDLASATTAKGTYNLSGGTVSAPNFYVGGNASAAGGTATLSIAGGAMTVTGVVKDWNANSIITLTGGTLSAGSLDLPNWNRLTFNAGTLNLTGGTTAPPAGQFNIGATAAGTCTVNLSAGSLNGGIATVVGNFSGGVATFNQTGGAHTASALSIANLPNTTGLYTLSGTSATLSTGACFVGGAGIGTFTQSAGTHTASVDIVLGFAASANGTYNLSGGTVTAPNLYVGGTNVVAGGTGTVSLTGGAMTIADTVKVWNANSKITLNGGTLSAATLAIPDWSQLYFFSGTLNLTGGASAATGFLTVGSGLGPAGTPTVNLSAGSLTVLNGFSTTVGNQAGSVATFNQTGGTHTTGSIAVGNTTGSTGAYNLSGTSLLTTADSYIGGSGIGTFTQTGGTHTASSSIELAYFPSAQGTYNLSAGTVTAPSLLVGGSFSAAGGTGAVSLTGGAMTVSGLVKVWNATSSITLNGGTLSAGSVSIPDWGQFTFKKGTLNLTAGDSTGAGVFIIGNAAGTSVVNLSAGSLNTNISTFIGDNAGSVATFNQTGGTHICSSVRVALATGSTGLYTLSGPSSMLTTDFTIVGDGGAGTFTQSGGTHTTTVNGIFAGIGNSSNGRYDMSGGTATAPEVYLGCNLVQASGTGTLSMTGGLMTVAGQVKLWNANSSINLNGGTLSAGILNFAPGSASMLTFNGGTWSHTGASALFANNFIVGALGGTIDVPGPTTTLTLGGNAQPAPAAPLPGPALAGGAGGPAPVTGQVTKTGAGILRVTGSLANVTGVNVNAGTLDFANATVSPVRSLTVAAGATAVVSAGMLHVGDPATIPGVPMSIVGSARLDLGTRAMTITTAAAPRSTTFNNVRNLIVQAYHATGAGNNGDWAGAGITSSTAQGNSSRAVGYALADDIYNFADATPDTFFGQPVFSGQILARLTLAGDANLDGVVDFNDLVRLAQNYNTTVSAQTVDWWPSGDFTYDGVTDFNDLVKLAQNYNTALPTEPVPGATADFNADLAAAFASVPEPSSALGCIVAGIALTARRRRRTRHPV